MKSHFQRTLLVVLLLLLIFGATFSDAANPSLLMSGHSIVTDQALAELAAVQSQIESVRKRSQLAGMAAASTLQSAPPRLARL